MPLIHFHSPTGTFDDTARDALADQLTTIALECERLPMEPFDKSTCWIYFHEFQPDAVYHGGKPGGTPVISLEVNCFRGLPTPEGKRALYERFTAAIARHAGLTDGATVPVYILVREVDPLDWGVFGGTITLDDVRTAHPGRAPI